MKRECIVRVRLEGEEGAEGVVQLLKDAGFSVADWSLLIRDERELPETVMLSDAVSLVHAFMCRVNELEDVAGSLFTVSPVPPPREPGP